MGMIVSIPIHTMESDEPDYIKVTVPRGTPIPVGVFLSGGTMGCDENSCLGPIETTARGFEIICFKDYNDNNCSLQQSSLALYEPPGTSAIWLGIDENRMHLSLEQVKVLAGTLQEWVDGGTFGNATKHDL